MRPPLMAARPQMVAILLLLATWLNFCSGCDVDNAVYKVTVKFLWSEDTFPKDYPLHHPKAQWSPLLGQSHNSSYHLYTVGNIARPSIRKFAQFGKLDELLEEGDDDQRVYDQFQAPAVVDGTGETGNMIFLNGEHSLVSVICSIMPSPDWFVGVDSLDLCVDSSWLEPLDAGAASGLTFTAPPWETSPEPVTKHGPRHPNHPSAGFYYPDLRDLPAIAKIEFLKYINQYSFWAYILIRSKNIHQKNKMNELLNRLRIKDKLKGSPRRKVNLVKNYIQDVTTKISMDQLKDLEEDEVKSLQIKKDDNNVIVVTKAPITDESSMDDVVLAVAHGKRLGLGKHLPRHFRSRLHHAVNKIQPEDCLVSEWSHWSSFTVTCGVGDMYRSRRIIRQNTKNGRGCPFLTETKRCGNENSCSDVNYFE